ncbi:unnamed protein product [Acanthoscelides obtectus]|uniref:Uncharacterized protein n=1 Tax=Acanthoscelides obtectus TaxID=200917 RepID=A0A9P0K631_ACAOB|nr:unnamed protein product [Acanthoscelides obtectus]CAK1652357.1 Probable G-protein coupled receptor CG31760 [Acanthoscelides obtectus]
MEGIILWKTHMLIIAILTYTDATTENELVKKEDVDASLQVIYEVAIRSLGSLCVTEQFRFLTVPLDTLRFESVRQKADLAATLLQDLGVAHHNGKGGQWK